MWAVHPGEILKKEFLKPMGLSNYAFARSIGVTAQRIGDVVLKKNGISADMAIRFAKYFDTTPEFWMNLQTAYELNHAGKNPALRSRLRKIRPHSKAA